MGRSSQQPTLDTWLIAEEWVHVAVVKSADSVQTFKNAEPWGFAKYIPQNSSTAGPHVIPTPVTHAILTKLKAGECIRHSIQTQKVS